MDVNRLGDRRQGDRRQINKPVSFDRRIGSRRDGRDRRDIE
tara:strand:- start:168 stop:290 length:123 start_codon:yes stop_codon:yes gene_type:complete